MAGELLLGIDIGTYSAKGVLCAPDGEVLATAVIEHELSLPRPGWAEHDPERVWWGGVTGLCRQLLGGEHRGDAVGGVAVSAIGPCLLPVDAAGDPLRPGMLYGIDTRATAEIAWLNATFGEPAMLELAGMALTSQSIGPKLLWLRRHEPDVFARAAAFHAASSFIVRRLTGEDVMDVHTASYFNPLFDLRHTRWDDRFAAPIVELNRLPRLLWSTEIAGTVTPAAAAATGLAAGTPVTAGTIDAAAEALSVGVVDPGDMMVMYGSTMFFIQVTAQPVPDRAMWSCAYCLPGRYGVEGGLATTGALTRGFREQLAPDLRAAEAAGGPNAYGALAELAAASSPGAHGLICLPYFAGERTPLNDPLARGVYAGLTLSHTRGDLYRASLEGTGFGVRHNLETMTAMQAPPRRLVAVGGGAQNRAWLQIVSDITGLSQDLPARTTGAAYGDAFLAGLATGLVPQVTVLARDWVRIADRLEPDVALAGRYAELYGIYRRLYTAAQPELHALARLGEDRIA